MGIKKQLLFVVVACLSIMMSAHHGSAMLTRDEGRKIIIGMLQKYYPLAYRLINEYENAPDEYHAGNTLKKIYKNDFWSYSNKLDEISVAKKLDVVVHEMCHEYAAHMCWPILEKRGLLNDFDTSYKTIFAGFKEPILIPITKTFPSKEIAGTFSEEIKTFRFDKYITKPIGGENAGTQAFGVYGLIDELNAYYHQYKTAHNLVPYYKSQTKNILNAWIDNYYYADRSHRAYLEFKLYILKYLLYARDEERSVYRGVMNNTNFKKAFTSLDKAYAALVKDYYRTKETIIPFLNKKGYRVYKQGNYLMYPGEAYQDSRNLSTKWHIDMKGKELSSRLDYYSKEIEPLEKELQKKEYKDLIKELATY